MSFTKKPQGGFAHPILVFVVIAALAAVGLIGWRVHMFGQQNRAQAAADRQVAVVAPKNGGPVIYGIDLGNSKQTPINLSNQLPDLPAETIAPDMEPSTTLHKFFETVRNDDPYGLMYYLSADLLKAIQTQTHNDTPEGLSASCRRINECRALTPTAIIGQSFTQTSYRNRVGQQGVTLSYKLSDVNKAAARLYQANTQISFSLVPYTIDSKSYWAIDNITVGPFSLR